MCAIVVEWESRSFRHIGLRRILESQDIVDCFPTDWPAVAIAKRLPKPLRVELFNYPAFSKQPSPADLPAGMSCPCRRFFPERFRTVKDCVYTGDLSLVRNKQLRSLLQCGTSFRTRVPRPSPVDAIRAALAGFAHEIIGLKKK